MNSMKITIIGAGYVGYSLGLALSENHNIKILDIDKKKVQLINKSIPIFEEELVKKYLTKNLKLSATDSENGLFENEDFVIISLPTNFDKLRNEFDTSLIDEYVLKIYKSNSSIPIIIKSTVPIGYTESISKINEIENIIFCPEFLREDSALKDTINPSRIIFGTKNKSKVFRFANALKSLSKKDSPPILYMNSSEAEAVKLFSNAFLANRVAFFNEIDNFALENQLNTKEIINGISYDKRIGNFYNNPSFGYGGYCLPKDTKQLKSNFKDLPQNIFSATIDSNLTRIQYLSEKIIATGKKNIGVYRLQMKKNSDNYRESAVLKIMKILVEKKISLLVYEPQSIKNTILGFEATNDLEFFKSNSDLILANRLDKEIKDVQYKIFTRDIFNRD